MHSNWKWEGSGVSAIRSSAQVLLPGVMVLYPFLVYFGLRTLQGRTLGLLLLLAIFLLILGFKILEQRGNAVTNTNDKRKTISRNMSIGIAIAIPLATVSALYDDSDFLLYYPVLINFSFFCLFGFSLFDQSTFVERMASAGSLEITEEIRRYLRKVTIAWCLFFICNGAVALYTATEANHDVWVIYNGFLSYVLIGSMFVGEFAVRSVVMRRNRNAKDE